VPLAMPDIAIRLQEVFRHQPLLLVGLVAGLGFYFGGLARRVRLPSLIGFMVLGVLLGPSVLGLFEDAEAPGSNLGAMEFVTHIALGLVAFVIGSELNLHGLRQLGRGILAIILAESLAAFAVVAAAVYAVTGNGPLALLFGAVAPASAPAGTVAVIQEYRARGSLTRALYAVVGFDDGLAILIYGLAAAAAKVVLLSRLGAGAPDGGVLGALGPPLLEVFASLLVGGAFGWVLCVLARRVHAPRDMFILIFSAVLLASGIANAAHLSLILTNMMIGFVLVNALPAATVQRVTAPLQDVMPLVFILFFALAGAHLRVDKLPALGLVGLVYVLARAGGLIGGAQLGGWLGRVEGRIRKWIGLGILSQAGVAIGLALITRNELGQLAARPAVAEALEALPAGLRADYDPVAIGSALLTTIMATCVFFEVVGPILTKVALSRAGEIPPELARPGAGPGGSSTAT